jgi:hypothetical protein
LKDEEIPLFARIKGLTINWLRAEIGVTPPVLFLWLATVIALITAFIFVCLSMLNWLEFYFGPLMAAVVMASVFGLCALVALLFAITGRKRTQGQARAARLANRAVILADPVLLQTVLSVSRKFGWRRTIPLGLLAVLGKQLASVITRQLPHVG